MRSFPSCFAIENIRENENEGEKGRWLAGPLIPSLPHKEGRRPRWRSDPLLRLHLSRPSFKRCTGYSRMSELANRDGLLIGYSERA